MLSRSLSVLFLTLACVVAKGDAIQFEQNDACRFDAIGTDDSRHILGLGLENGSIAIKKFSPSGTLLWDTLLAAGPDSRGTKVVADADGNVYATWIDSASGANSHRITALRGDNGVLRWTRNLVSGLTNAQTGRPSVAVAKVANSVFLYVASEKVINPTLTKGVALRLNSANGLTLWSRDFAGTTNGRNLPCGVLTMPNSVPIFSFNILDNTFPKNVHVRLSTADGTPVWTRIQNGHGEFLDPVRMLGTGHVGLPGSNFEVLNVHTAALLETPQNRGRFASDRMGKAITASSYQVFLDGQSYVLSDELKDLTNDSSGQAQVLTASALQQFPARQDLPVSGVHLITADSEDDLILAGNGKLMKIKQELLAEPDRFHLPIGSTLVMAAPGVLKNDAIYAGTTLSVVQAPAHGVVELSQNGGYTYTPNASFNGIDSFSYQLTRGSEASVAVVNLFRLFPQISTPEQVFGGAYGMTYEFRVAEPPTQPVAMQTSDNSTAVTLMPTTLLPRQYVTYGEIRTLPVSASFNVSLTFSIPGWTQTRAMRILTGGLKSAAFETTEVQSGYPAQLRINLSGQPLNPVKINLGPNSGAIRPNQLSVTMSTPTTTVSASTFAVAAAEVASITVNQDYTFRTASITLRPSPVLLELQAGWGIVGESIPYTIVLDRVTTEPITATITATNGLVVPTAVEIPAGVDQWTFNGTATANGFFECRATVLGNALSRFISVTVNPLAFVNVNPTTIQGGGATNGVVKMKFPLPASRSVALTSSDPLTASVPESVDFQQGDSEKWFVISTVPVTTTKSVTLSASLAGVTKTKVISVTP